MISRQRAWQLARIADGKCQICAQPKHPQSRSLCQPCLDKRVAHSRARGYAAWRFGGPGRTPLSREASK